MSVVYKALVEVGAEVEATIVQIRILEVNQSKLCFVLVPNHHVILLEVIVRKYNVSSW